MNLRLACQPIGGYLAVTLLAAVLLGTFFWSPAKQKLLPRKRHVLLGLRLASILLAILAMLQPTLVYTKVRKQSASIVVLVDRSRSMQVADEAGERPRWQALTATLDGVRDAFSALAEDFDIQGYAFDRELVPLVRTGGAFQLDAQPEGTETALGAALEQVLERESGKRLAAVLLLSDGAQRAYAPADTPPQTAARRLADLGYPLFTFAFGQARSLGQVRDVALTDLVLASPTVFVKNRLSVGATLRADGLAEQTVPVELHFETAPGKLTPVAIAKQKIASGSETLPIELAYTPQVAGEYKLSIAVPPQPGELVTTNNELSTFVTVLKGGVNVLYLEGSLARIEKRFLRTSLDGSPNIKLDYMFLDAEHRDTRPADLAERFAAGKYDVYLLGDIDATAFDEAELAALARAVDSGAGLAMLGGFHSFGPGGYQKTPLAELLPIVMEPLERQRFGDPISSDLHLVGELRMQPTDVGLRHFILRLADGAANAAAWNALPTLDGANRFRGLTPRASVLAQSADGAPLLVAQETGFGRVLAFAGDSTWRWVLEGHETEHKRFWRQVVLWLAHKDQATDGDVWVRLDPRRFARRRRVEFTAGAQSPEGAALTDAQLSAEITLPDGTTRSLRLARDGDHGAGIFQETDQAGDYLLKVTATRAGQTIGTAQARFLVFQRDLELDNPAADRSTLASLAAMTGGENLPPEELGPLLQRIRRRPVTLEVEQETKQTLWDTWPFFLLFVGLLVTEWGLRKRWGLV